MVYPDNCGNFFLFAMVCKVSFMIYHLSLYYKLKRLKNNDNHINMCYTNVKYKEASYEKISHWVVSAYIIKWLFTRKKGNIYVNQR